MDTNFSIAGTYDLRHFLRFCLEREFQIKLILNNPEESLLDKEVFVHITFFKGRYHLHINNRFLFEVDDALKIIRRSTTPELPKNITKDIDSTPKYKHTKYITNRTEPACLIINTLEYIFKDDINNLVDTVHILQPYRNGTFNPVKKTFSPAPRPHEASLKEAKEWVKK